MISGKETEKNRKKESEKIQALFLCNFPVAHRPGTKKEGKGGKLPFSGTIRQKNSAGANRSGASCQYRGRSSRASRRTVRNTRMYIAATNTRNTAVARGVPSMAQVS